MTLGVKFYQPFRAVDGAPIPKETRVGIGNNGAVFLPANVLRISDGEALGRAHELSAPAVILKDTVFVELDHAISIVPNPTAKELLRALKRGLLRKCCR